MATSKSTRALAPQASPIAGTRNAAPKGETQLRPLVLSMDLSYVVDMSQAPALAFHPDAHIEVVVSMALARTRGLERMLNAWACVADAEDVDVTQIAEVLQPQAAEVLALLEEIMRRVDASNTLEG